MAGGPKPGEVAISEPAAPARPDLFVNREISFLEFNQRIVQEAADPALPLLERLKFIGIVGANLDEFFMVRVAGLKQQLKSGVLETGPDGMTPSEQLSAIAQRAAAQLAETERTLLEGVIPALAQQGIRILRVAELGPAPRKRLAQHFETQIFPMLTPLAVDPGHPFPFIKNRTLNLAVHLLPETSAADAYPLLAVVQVPNVPRFVDVDMPGDLAVVFVDDEMTAHVGALFPGMRVLECVPFRVIRNWDLSIDEEEQEDLLETVEKELRRRWRLDAVRLEMGAEASGELVDRLRSALDLSPADVMVYAGPLALADLQGLVARVGRSDLRDEAFYPVLSPEFRDSDDVFAAIGKGDILLHHPYESYEPVVDLLDQASRDPAVLAIKQTLYRVSRDSPILESLITAAENGKQVTALVELKARLSEETNVEWARHLERSGVQVVYGMIGLKTHCKVTMVVRRGAGGIRRYVHLGTGNYNEETARIYSDLSYFTARQDVCDDVSSLFNLLTGYSAPPSWKKLVVAPLRLRHHLLDLIEDKIRVAQKGKKAKIVFKSNALIDPRIIQALTQASQAGVEVILCVRGPCSLRVGIPGVSDRITVRMVIDRFLEHSRLFYFASEDQEDVFITSTDIMPRNFDRRVEVMLPIEDPRLKRRIVDEILAIELADNTKAAVLQENGTFSRLKPGNAKPVRSQAEFIKLARARAAAGDVGKKRKKPKRDKKEKKKG